MVISIVKNTGLIKYGGANTPADMLWDVRIRAGQKR